MATRAPRPCARPGCPELVTDDPRCPTHRRARRRRQDDRRGSSTARGYGSRWQRIRKSLLARYPLCVMCQAEGRVEAATEVDHIDGNSRNNDRENLRPLCKPCHSRRTIRDQGPNAERASS